MNVESLSILQLEEALAEIAIELNRRSYDVQSAVRNILKIKGN